MIELGSIGELFIIGIAAIILLKPQDWLKLIRQLGRLVGHIQGWRFEMQQAFWRLQSPLADFSQTPLDVESIETHPLPQSKRRRRKRKPRLSPALSPDTQNTDKNQKRDIRE